jgi:hypothetical protein
VFWSTVPTLLLELVELEAAGVAAVELDAVSSDSDVLEADDEDDDDEVEVDDDVPDCACAVSAIPDTRPTVRAPAAAAAAVAAIVARLRSARPFMTTTFVPAGSGLPHQSVKAFSSLAGRGFRARAGPA